MHNKRNSTRDRLKIFFLNGLSLLFKSVSFLLLHLKKLSRTSFPGTFIISVDNLSFGGTGKTSLVLAIGTFLESRGVTFAIVTRGYKSKLEKERMSTRVTELHTAIEVGDEVLLLARRFPRQHVYVGHNRHDAITRARAAGIKFILLDDGFQSTHIHKNLKIMLVNPAHPYYYLRHFKFLKNSEDIVLYLNSPASGPRYGGYSFAWEGFYDSSHQPVDIPHHAFVAFAALGDNSRFQEDLNPFSPLGFKGFPDHHPFSKTDLQNLDQWRQQHNARYLVCTEKDFMKIFPYKLSSIPFIYVRNSIKFNIDLMSLIWSHAEKENNI